jgi:hypothetical protein
MHSFPEKTIMRAQLSLQDFQSSKKGRPIGDLLARPETIQEMELLSREDRPAVLALDRALPEAIDLDDTEKKHVGRWVRDVLADRGWRVRKRKGFRSGRIFSSGAVYERPTAPAARQSGRDDDISERIRRAQEIVAGFRTGNYSVDDFLRDKRAEAAREL